MEGREQKHQMLRKYMGNTAAQCVWPKVFQYDYIQLCYLRLNGFDTKPSTRPYQYIPVPGDGFLACTKCSLELSGGSVVCRMCDNLLLENAIRRIDNVVPEPFVADVD